MKSEAEIRRALKVLEHTTCTTAPYVEPIGQCADVLCWILEVPNYTAFVRNLETCAEYQSKTKTMTVTRRTTDHNGNVDVVETFEDLN